MSEQDSIHYTQKTIFPSKLVTHYFHDFKIRVLKNQNGTVNNDRYFGEQNNRNNINQRCRMIQESSWNDFLTAGDSMYDFGDDDDEGIEEVLNRSNRKIIEFKKTGLDDELEEEIMNANIFVFTTSVSINNGEVFDFYFPIISASVLKSNDQSKEDTLIIVLETGYMLMLRMVLIEYNNFEPIIVLNHNCHFYLENAPPVIQPGYQIFTNHFGNLIAMSSFIEITSLYDVQFDKNQVPRIRLRSNLGCEGVILRTCFLQIDNQYQIFLRLICTHKKILELQVTQLFNEKNKKLSNHTHLLRNTFEVPLFVIPLEITKSILFLQPTGCTVRGLCYLLSSGGIDEASLKYPSIRPNHDEIIRPNAFYTPKNKITCMPCSEYTEESVIYDQILISTESSPSMYLMEVFCNTKKQEWSIKLRKMFSQPTTFSLFSLEEIGKTGDSTYAFDLVYSNEMGFTDLRKIELVEKNDFSKSSWFSLKYLEDCGSSLNSFPMFDFKIVNSLSAKHTIECSSQEFWGIARYGKRSALMNLKKGYVAEKSDPIMNCYGVEKMFRFEINGLLYVILSGPLSSCLIHYNVNYNPEDLDKMDLDCEENNVLNSEFVKLPDSLTYEETVHFTQLTNGYQVQITKTMMKIGDFSQYSKVKTFKLPYDVLLAASYDNIFAVFYETEVDGIFKIEFALFEIRYEEENDSIEIIDINDDRKILKDLKGLPTMVQFFKKNGKFCLVVGTDANNLHIFDDTTLTIELNTKITQGHAFMYPHSFTHIIDDIYLLTSKNGEYIIVLIKNGFEILDCIKVGDTYPLDVITTEDPKKIYLSSKELWKLDINKSYYPERVLVSEITDRGFNCGVYMKQKSSSKDRFLAVRGDKLCALFVSDYQSTAIKKISLDKSCLKMFYCEFSTLFIVIPVIENPKEDDKLIFIDHKSKKVLENNIKELILFREEEYPICIHEWIVPHKQSADSFHRNLAVGCRSANGTGSVKMFSMKKEKGIVKLNLLTEWEEHEPVTCINQLEDGTVLYGTGERLVFKKYSTSRSIMESIHEVERFNSEIKGIFVDSYSENIVVVTLNDSFQLLAHNPSKSDTDYDFSYKATGIEPKCLTSDVVFRKDISGTEASIFLTVGDKKTQSICTIFLQDQIGVTDGGKIVSRAKLSYIPKVAKCFFFPPWMNFKERDSNPKLTDDPSYRDYRFITVGLNGQVDLFTRITDKNFMMLNDIFQTMEKNKGIKRVAELDPNEICNSNWTGDNVIRIDGLLDKLQSKDIDKLLHYTLV